MKTNGKMSFKDYIFSVNPSVIRIVHKHSTAVNQIPYGLKDIRDLGDEGRIISGEGEFFGNHCAEQFDKLKTVFAQGGGGMLYIPSQKPLYAIFKRLELIGEDIADVIKYGFEFEESFDNIENISPVECIGNGEKSLWDFAYEYDLLVESLMTVNPDITRPDTAIPKGKVVKLC